MPEDIKTTKPEKNHVVGYVLLILLAVLLVVSFFLLARDFRVVRRADLGENRLNLIQLLLRHKQANEITDKDVEYIDYWMTFGYIDTVFNLPSEYLKDRLNIANSRFPDITLGNYAKDAGLDRATFIVEVKKAVKDFLDMPKAK
jgi:hypothetical protein